MVLSGVVSVDAAIRSVNWDTMMLLTGMMVLVGVLGEAGLFVRLGRWARAWAAGDGWRLLWVFFGITAAISAVLDNVTTVLLLSPALMQAAEGMDLDPVPFLMAEVAASNLGGLATLIGDPPNILIGTAAHLSFMQFVRYLAPAAVLLLVGVAIVLPRLISLAPRPLPQDRRVTIHPIEPVPSAQARKLPGLLAILAAMLAAFMFQQVLGVAAGVIAVVGALGALGYARPPLRPLMRMVDWGTLGFFLGIFILVGALESTGVVNEIAGILTLSHPGRWLPLMILAGAALFSAFFDNVPLVAALIPILNHIMAQSPSFGIELWVALALGAAIGGNGTVIGASPNVVVQGLAREYGYRLNFRRFAGFGLRVAALTLLLGGLYLSVCF